MKNDLTCIEEALLGERGFLAELEKGCTTNKTAEWEEIVKTHAEELAALAETIKVLNDDDALELFKRPCGKKIGFEKVIKIIGDMITVLKKE